MNDDKEFMICSICEQGYNDIDNCQAIEEWGMCLTCDHLQTDNS